MTTIRLAAIAVLLFSCAAATAADFYVAPYGNDAWSGRLAAPAPGGRDGPVATIPRAKALVASLRRQHPRPDRPVTVALRGGFYELREPIVFGPEDSGDEQSPTIYEAFADETVTLSGGSPVRDWRVGQDGKWRATLDAVRSGAWSFSQLFVDGARRYRPRLPRSGYFSIARNVSPTQFCFAGADEFNDARITDLHHVEVLAFHDWSASRLRVAALDRTRRCLQFTGPSSTEFVAGHRFLVDNVGEAQIAAGEFFLDRASGLLIYSPLAGESPDHAQAIAPRLERLLVLQGDPANGRWVQHIQFHRLQFAHANWNLPFDGQSFAQAEIGLSAAIHAVGARHIVFDACAVRHVGGYAMALGGGSQHVTIENCELSDLGGGGVKIGFRVEGPWEQTLRLPLTPDWQTSHNVVRDCLIAHGGRLHPGGVGIWIGQASSTTVEHNEIADFYQTGVSVGWTWGYGPSAAHDNDIGFNHIHAIGQAVTSDMGGVYTLGRQPGTRVHDNHVEDVRSYAYGGWGLYADEGSSGILFERNLVTHAQSGGFFQHYGADNRVVNNVFAFGGECQLNGTRVEPHTGFVFAHNIVYWDGASRLICDGASAPAPTTQSVVMNENLYWRTGGDEHLFPGDATIEAWRRTSGQDADSLVADPQFADPSDGDFRLPGDSPASSLHFAPFDALDAGRRQPRADESALPGFQ